MNESQFGNKVRQILNQGLTLDARASGRLRAAREQALARQRAELSPVLAWADNVAGSFGGWGGFSLRLVVPLLVLAVGASAVYTWQQQQLLAEVEEIDALLLTDELPLDAYLDRNFQSWLKKRAAEQ
jgi:hypothetical protein